MTEKQVKARLENLTAKASRRADYLDTLRELKGKAEQRQQEAHEMANYPNQKYADDWAREEKHQAELIKRLDEMAQLFSDELDQVCEQCEALRAKYNYYK